MEKKNSYSDKYGKVVGADEEGAFATVPPSASTEFEQYTGQPDSEGRAQPLPDSYKPFVQAGTGTYAEETAVVAAEKMQPSGAAGVKAEAPKADVEEPKADTKKASKKSADDDE